jgi:glyoxylate utilization-related uncharacterized protein
MSGARIIDALKEAVAGDFARVTIEGQVWTRGERRQPIETAPKDGNCFLAVVEGEVRQVVWGKTSHIRIYGWIFADQGEETDLCSPTHWQPLPALPESAA